MRVLIDTNVLISHLLSPQQPGVINSIFAVLASGAFTLLIPEALLDEVYAVVVRKPALSSRIPLEYLREFLDLLSSLGEPIPRIQGPIPAMTRDPKDDYLLAYAIVGRADLLVSGDQDLLILSDPIDGLEILSPRAFSEMFS